MNSSVGLGIDAGGTYTDVVVYDLVGDAVLAKAKALTTPWDYTDGIEAALDLIPARHLVEVGLVSVSTTLATNAIVEHQGQKVGVLLMPPYGRFQDSDLAHTPKAVVQGQMDMDGSVLKPVDPREVETIGKAMVRDHGIKAFAVSGCGATVNAAHEIEVRKVLQDATGLSVTCGHTLSDMLGMYERATTAIFNARVVPFVEAFLQALDAALARRGVHAPVMVVKGDGTLMSADMARERPVETIFSGPAASVVGARKLTGLMDALVVDIGGTTTDVAAIRNSRVEVCSRGNVVGGVHTHVKALNMRTTGLGGDSAIAVRRREIAIGPRRVMPIACLAREHPRTAQALDFVEGDLAPYATDTATLQVLALTRHQTSVPLEQIEKDVLEVLARRPHSVEELVRVLDLPYSGIGLFSRLIRQNVVAVSTLTPTDLLHAEGRVRLWDVEAARRMCGIYARIVGRSYGDFADQALRTFTHHLAVELFRKLMDGDVDPAGIDSSRACQAILRRWLSPSDNELAVTMTLPYPVIGVGAPAGELLPEASKLLNAGCVIPPDHDVANAIGAVTSAVSISRSIKVAPKDDGRFSIRGLAEGHEFDDLQEAVEHGKRELVRTVLDQARRSGMLNPEVGTSIADDTAANAYGGEMYLGTVITASAMGRPKGADG